ncbi:MAG: 6-bladed beta-propeller [Proteobacteria bacterium]|nr:6-bladed beta-propeller [Pseudomonadota bacterium]
MRKLFPVFLALTLAACGAPSLPPPSLISQVQFLNEIQAGSPGATAVDQQGNIYAAQQDGSIRVINKEGKQVATLPVQDQKGRRILKKPAGIAIDNDLIYVTDNALDHVAIFSTNGEFLDAFGKSGKGPKEFDEPRGIKVYQGVIYVADYGNDRIQLFGSNGVFLKIIDGPPIPKATAAMSEEEAAKLTNQGSKNRIKEPIDVAVDFQGQLYVVDEDAQQVKIYDHNGNFIAIMPETFKPLSVEITPDGIYVADSESYSIKKFSLDRKLLFSFGSKGEARAQFKSMDSLTADSQGRIYLTDRGKGLIHAFLPEKGRLTQPWEMLPPPVSTKWLANVNTIAGRGVWDGKTSIYTIDSKKNAILKITDGIIANSIQLNDISPVALALEKSGDLLVLDGKGKRVVRMTADGTIVSTFGSPGSAAGKLSKPTDLAVNSKGIIFIADRGNEWVQAFSSDGVFLNVLRDTTAAPLDEPIAISLDDKDNLYVLDADRMMVAAYSPEGKPMYVFGRKGDSPGDFDDPVDIYATTQEVFVLDNDTENIKVFSNEGRFLRAIGIPGDSKGEFNSPTAITPMGKTAFAVSDDDNKRIQILANVYTPMQTKGLAAEGGMHSVKLIWQPKDEPYISTYTILRSDLADQAFEPIGTTESTAFTDNTALPDKDYFYRVAAIAENGNQGPPGDTAGALSTKYIPAAPSNIEALPEEWKITLKWEPSTEGFVTEYMVYRKDDGEKTVIGKTSVPSFTQDSLSADTPYFYMVSAVSSDGVEGEAAIVRTSTKTSSKPPLSIDVIAMTNIFSNTYKIYETEGVGKIKITNNTGSAISKIKVTFTVKEFMDFSSEEEVDTLNPGEFKDVSLKVVFNNKILNVTEDTPVQTEITASYYLNSELKTINKNHKINIYEKHRMSWDEQGRFATFITPKDPILLEFIRSVVTQYPDAEDTLQRAAAIFNSLGSLGVTYMQDPSNPYQVTSGITDFVDYIQYPRETLQRKSGDCDDLVALYAASLESLGIQALAVEIPGHMLMIFSTGVEASSDNYTMNDWYIIKDGMLWVPVETTLVGSSFITAWEKGSGNYYAWKEKGLSLVDLRESWGVYKPASLPDIPWRPGIVTRENIEQKFNNEFQTVRKISVQTKIRKYRNTLETDANNEQALLQIGIIYAKAGETGEAVKAFSRILENTPNHAGALNNIGNVHFIDGKYEEAKTAYLNASQAEPDDALVWINLARCNLHLNLQNEAKDAFTKAQELDPQVSSKYRGMSLKLMSTL